MLALNTPRIMRRVTYKDAPAVDEDKEHQEHSPMDWEKQDEQVVGERLSKSIQKVEGMRGVGCGDYNARSVRSEIISLGTLTNPFVMGLM
jgi:hypothetical protein